MAESTVDQLKYRGSKIDSAVDAAESGSPAPQPTGPKAQPASGPFTKPAPRSGGNPDNQLPETAFHKVKSFFGVKD